MTFIDLPVLQDLSAIKLPASLVVRYGLMRMMGEFPYDGDSRPGCGAKVVMRSRRGTELAEVVTTTCSNGGCAKSITRDKLMEYIDNSGGQDYPFSTEGRILRVATPNDISEQARIEAERPQYVSTCKTLIREMELPMKLVDVEMLLGGEMVTFYFLSEDRIDFRALVKHLATRFHTRIQMHQVGARDEARLVADYETCGQHCCCKQFLKVLKPISMGAAKMQKATLDPNKISGRCGRLKCCLRYEENTYDELRKKLPRLGSRVRTAEGVGVVEETMILTQLVKVRLIESDRRLAVANEELLERDLPEPPRGERRDAAREPRPGGRGERPAREPRPDQAPREPRSERAPREPRPEQAPREPRSEQPTREQAPREPRPDGSAPRSDAPRLDAPRSDAPRSDAPRSDAPRPRPENRQQNDPRPPREPRPAAPADPTRSQPDPSAADRPASSDPAQPTEPRQPKQDPSAPRGMGSLGRGRRRRRGPGPSSSQPREPGPDTGPNP